MIKPIPGFSGYFVSDIGEVFSTRRHPGNPNGELQQMSLNLDKDGYHQVRLISDAGPRRNVKAHQLVLLAFLGPKPPKMGACHRDDVKTNNRLGNLYWGSNSDNMKDAVRHGTSNLLKYDDLVIDQVRDLHKCGYAQKEIASLTGVSRPHVSHIVSGRVRGDSL